MPQAASPLQQVFTFSSQPGIRRDGPSFDSGQYTAGVWMRFQRSQPKKVGGYKRSFTTPEIPRGMITQSVNGVNYIIIGTSSGIDVFAASTASTTGSGPYPAIFISTYGQTTIQSVTDQTTFVVSGNKVTWFYVGANIVFDSELSTTTYTITSSTVSGTSPNQITTIVVGTAFTGTPTQVWVYAPPLTYNPDRSWQFDIINNGAINQLQVVAHGAINLKYIDTNIPQPIYVGNVLPSAGNQWIFRPLADTAGQNPTGQLIQVTNGVMALYPGIVVGYGANGLITNCNSNQLIGQRTLFDWNSGIANTNNYSAGNFVKGLIVRGGNASPSALLWGIDSLVRMSFNPAGTNGYYWSYDLLGKSSVMSSNSIIQADNIYYWMGVDRFFQFNGTIQELPIDSHNNYIFDNINYSQQQKVFAIAVPRYNEVWWFYPRGTSTECNDVIVYNTRGQFWFDLGGAVGCRRTCGFSTEVYPRPIIAGWESASNYILEANTIDTPSGLTPPTANQFYLSGDRTGGFAPGNYASLQNTNPPIDIQITTSRFFFSSTYNATLVTTQTPLAANLPIGTQVYASNSSGFPVWEHENGYNRTEGSLISSIYSSFTTPDISWVGGSPSGDSPQGADQTMRLVRIEPNFVQSGNMKVSVLGRSYASSNVEQVTGPFEFAGNTSKVHVRNANYRLTRLLFESEAVSGSYENGRLLLTVDQGGARPNE